MKTLKELVLGKATPGEIEFGAGGAMVRKHQAGRSQFKAGFEDVEGGNLRSQSQAQAQGQGCAEPGGAAPRARCGWPGWG